jgi:hypothetical protein
VTRGYARRERGKEGNAWRQLKKDEDYLVVEIVVILILIPKISYNILNVNLK